MSKLSYIFSAIIGILLLSCANNDTAEKTADPRLVKYPQKADMILQTDRPANLETPLSVLKQDITPNESFFVRWHLSQTISKIDADTFRLYIGGAVEKPFALSINDLKTKFAADSVTALAICVGNSRSTFKPGVPGVQWANGAMGNAKWKGVKLKDILAMAGIKKGAVDVTFSGLDRAPLPATPAFVKSLDIAHATDGEVLVAYEMNGQELPMLNGYPLKLVVPGWYATYWVGELSNINVLTQKYDGFWMTKAYMIADNARGNERPDSLAQNTVPVSRIKLHSIFVEPEPNAIVKEGKACHIEGLAYNDGTGIQKVELSLDSGTTWLATTLNPEISKYSWRRWKYEWTPSKAGTYHLCLRATDKAGNTQTDKQWNRSGYARGFIEHLNMEVR